MIDGLRSPRVLNLLGGAHPGREKRTTHHDLLTKRGFELVKVSSIADITFFKCERSDILELLLSFTLFPLARLLSQIRNAGLRTLFASGWLLGAGSIRLCLRNCPVPLPGSLWFGLRQKGNYACEFTIGYLLVNVIDNIQLGWLARVDAIHLLLH